MTTVAINLPDGLTFNKGTASLLNNTASQAVVNLTGITGGFINVVVDIDAGTDVRQEFILLFSKNAVGSTWSISTLSTTGENSLTTFDIDTSGILRASVGSHAATYTSGTCTYSINAPALGTAFPAMISASNVLGSTTGVAPAAGVIGQRIDGTTNTGTGIASGATRDNASIALTPGNWLLFGACGTTFATVNPTVTLMEVAISPTSATFDTPFYKSTYAPNASANSISGVMSAPVRQVSVSSNTTYYLVGKYTTASGAVDHFYNVLYAIRIG
jgi:hypothetical protein